MNVIQCVARSDWLPSRRRGGPTTFREKHPCIELLRTLPDEDKIFCESHRLPNMVVISAVSEVLEKGLIPQMSWRLGLITGAVHHIVCQFPVQSDVLTTLCVWMMGNLAFLISIYFHSTFAQIIFDAAIFNSVYVHTSL